MKKLLISISLFGSIGVFFACQRKADITYNYPPKPEKSASANKLAAIFAEAAPATQSFPIDAAAGGSFSSNNNIQYSIPPNAFVKQDNSPVTGNVEVLVQEIQKASEMILGNKPTVTNEGQFLLSFGEFKVDARQGADVLKLRDSVLIQVAVPRRDSVQGIAKGIPMWNGDTVVSFTTSGHDFENNPVTITKQFAANKGIDWAQDGNVATPTPSALSLTIDKLGIWKNCDALYGSGLRTTVICYFTNVFNTDEQADGYMGIQPNLLFFKKAGENTVVKLYNSILNAPAGKNGFLSYQNSFEIDMSGTFLAIVYKDDKFYAATKDVTIPAPTGANNYVGIDLVLSELSQADMLALVASMNAK